MSLIEKIKAARELNIEAGGFTFKTRRPTDLEVVEMRGQVIKQGDLLRRYVIGWVGVTELDLIPGGTALPVEFETDLFMEWVADQPELWAPLATAIMDNYTQHQHRLSDSLGKQDAG
jgi:hypothetical protein